MKSSIKLFYLILLLALITSVCKAQMVDNKVNLYAGYSSGIFHGKQLLQENGFIYPSFYSNLNNVNGLSVKVLYKSYQNVSFGLDMAICKASNWECNNSLIYEGSLLTLISFSPVIQLHTKFSKSGFFNSGKCFLEFAPVIGKSSATLSGTLFNIQDSNDSILAPPTNRNDPYYGMKGNAGIEWALSQSTSLVVSYSFQSNSVTSILYSDTYFKCSQLNVGITLKLNKDKRFLYRE